MCKLYVYVHVTMYIVRVNVLVRNSLQYMRTYVHVSNIDTLDYL